MHSTQLTTALAFLAPMAAAQACIPESQPNPIANLSISRYPITGTVNGTVAILPIDYALARSIIPAEYPILAKQYQQWLPWLRHDQYPAMLQTELDHDVYFGGAGGLSDFSRAGISFPFVDRLNDGYTAMSFNGQILITANATGVAAAFENYGYTVSPATFDPSCNAYAFVEDKRHHHAANGEVYFKAFGNDSSRPGIAWEMAPVQHSPYSSDFWYNVTNQPLFSRNTTICDNLGRLLNTSISEPPYAPVPVRGAVHATKPYFAKTTSWEGVYGLKLDQAFYEIDDVPCETLQGFSVVNAPVRA